MFYRRKFTPSKAAKRDFAIKMQEIEDFCRVHGISASMSNDSYYFSLNGQNYRVSNHTIKASNRGAYDWLGNQIRPLYHDVEADKNLICITAGKTRIIQIYNDLSAGRKLDKRGNVIYE